MTSKVGEFQADLNGLNQYPAYSELTEVRYDPDTSNLTFSLKFAPPCDKVMVRVTKDYLANYPNGPLSMVVGDHFQVIPSGNNTLTSVAQAIRELCQAILRGTPSTFGTGWGDDQGMGTPTTSWVREGTLELAHGPDTTAPGLHPQLVSDVSRVITYGAVLNDVPAIRKAVVVLSMSLKDVLKKTTCDGWNLSHNLPLEFRVTLDRSEYLAAPIKVEVGQAMNFQTGIFRGIVGQLQRVLQTFCDNVNLAQADAGDESSALSILLQAGYDEPLARAALAMTDDDVRAAAQMLSEQDQDTFDAAIRGQSPPPPTTEGKGKKGGKGKGGEAKGPSIPAIAAKKFPERKSGFFMQLLEYALQRLHSLPEYCVICDKPHIFGVGNMLQSSVCSREKCVFQFRELQVGADVADSVAVQSGVIDLLVSIAIAASKSSRWNLILNPFPEISDSKGVLVIDPAKKDQGTTCIDLVRKILESFPSMKHITQAGLMPALTQAHPLAPSMFHWIVNSNRSHLAQIQKPDLIQCMATPLQFIMVTANPELQSRFEAQKKANKGKTVWVFHGSRAENWHSILRNGLKNASGTNLQLNGTAYGSGIYLSPHANVSFGYSNINTSPTPGQNVGDYERSFIDQKSMLCIAVIELVDVETKKSGNIWVQPREDRVQTRFFFVYDRGFSGGGATDLEKAEFSRQFDAAAAKFGL